MKPASRYFSITSELKIHTLIWHEELLQKSDSTLGPPVILLHGFSQNAHIWDSLCEKIASERAVIAIDFRGHGGSSWDPEANYNHPALVNDLIFVIEQLSLTAFHLIGHSLGGRVAILYAAKYSNKLASLTIIDVGPEVAARTVAKIRSDAEAMPQSFSSLESYARYLKSLYFLAKPEIIERFAAHGLKTTEDGTLICTTDPAFTLALWSEEPLPTADPQSVVPFNDNICTYMSQISVPTFVIRGSYSAVLKRKTAQEMVNQWFPNATLLQVSGAGHTVMLDNADEFERVIIKLLSETEA